MNCVWLVVELLVVGGVVVLVWVGGRLVWEFMGGIIMCFYVECF